MPNFGKPWRLACAAAPFLAASIPSPVSAQTISALPDQSSHIRLSNRDVNHIICVGGDIEDVKFSAEKGLAVERGGGNAVLSRTCPRGATKNGCKYSVVGDFDRNDCRGWSGFCAAPSRVKFFKKIKIKNKKFTFFANEKLGKNKRL